MAAETRKILDGDIAVIATCVRVPVFIGHGEALNVEFENAISVEAARAALRKAPGISVVDHRVDEGYVTPKGSSRRGFGLVSRIRRDPTVPNGLALWVVADKSAQGRGVERVQIAELLAKDHLAHRDHDHDPRQPRSRRTRTLTGIGHRAALPHLAAAAAILFASTLAAVGADDWQRVASQADNFVIDFPGPTEFTSSKKSQQTSRNSATGILVPPCFSAGRAL